MSSFDNEYSRLIDAIGKETLQKLQSSRILLIGLRGLGVEIAKNLVLMGLYALDIYDQAPVEIRDLSAQFFFSENDVGKSRADITLPKLINLNERVNISILKEEITEEILKRYSVVAVTECESWGKLCEWNRVCHENNIKFLASDIPGLFGFVFCDFCPNFVVLDQNGEEIRTNILESFISGEKLVIKVIESKPHDLSDGDLVRFREVKGCEEINGQVFPVNCIDRYMFTIGDTRHLKGNPVGGLIEEVKQKKVYNYEMLSAYENLTDLSKVLVVDDSKVSRVSQYHLFLRTLLLYREKFFRNPLPYNEEDGREFLSLAKSFGQEFDEKLIKDLAMISDGYISPMATFLGGIVAQEIIKATSGKFTPLNQFLYFESLECLSSESPAKIEDMQACQNRYYGEIAIFGQQLVEKILNAKYFLVGAGAIGCEILKTWAMMGLGAGANGHIDVTDMDIIEISNLNRQFLYQTTDLGKLKSETAANAVKNINPNINIKAWSTKVAPETSNIFNIAFWNSLDGVCNALDNLESRLYVDSQCVLYGKSLLESGTMGPKGNTQVIVPFLTESYGSSRDPPPKQTAICLLHSFPNDIAHCIQWAREIAFEANFVEEPQVVNRFLEDGMKYINSLTQTSRNRTLKLIQSGCLERKKSFDECIHWARFLFENFYVYQPSQLLHNFPSDHVDSNGVHFWSGSRLRPQPIVFDPNNSLHLDFIVSATFLKAYNLSILKDETKPENLNDIIDHIKQVVVKVEVPPFVCVRGMKISTNESENSEEAFDDDQLAEKILKELENLKTNSSIENSICTKDHVGNNNNNNAVWRAQPVVFEKDNDSNFHIDFIHCASNLRAIEYNIPTVDRFKSKIIAGKIVPAIVTTTAIVSGLACLELYKLFQEPAKKIGDYRNTFLNLALPLIQQSEPLPPCTYKFQGKPFTLWDKIHIRIGDVTLREVLDYFHKVYNITVDFLGVGSFLVYMDFGYKARLDRNLKELVEEISKKKFDPDTPNFVLQINGVDEEDNAIDFIPEVVYWFNDTLKI